MVHHKHLLVDAESRLEPTVSLVSCESVGLLKTAVSLTIASLQFYVGFRHVYHSHNRWHSKSFFYFNGKFMIWQSSSALSSIML